MSNLDENVNAIYISPSELISKHHRLQELQEYFSSQFGSEPDFFVRTPGRVNIIGEHVDYCGFPVLPMAIDQCILLAVGCNAENSNLSLHNVEKDKFENFKCDLNDIEIELPQCGSGPEWHKYYLCGIKGVYEMLAKNIRPIGMCVAVSGNIPPASGLSSSSALVSAAVLATAHVHRIPLNRKQLASVSASCERYIGTEGGGMDQAIAYLAKTGCAQYIEFHPELNARPVQLPGGACFIVANSLAAKNKAASSDFNERVVECRLSARILAKRMKLSNWRHITRFAQLQSELKCTLEDMEDLALRALQKDVYTQEDICAELDIEPQELHSEFLTTNTQHMTQFKLRQRTLHVLQESRRVDTFRTICEQTTNGCFYNVNNENGYIKMDKVKCETQCDTFELPSNTLITDLSDLMRQSHRSLKELYECSHPDLDRIIAISDSMNGIGARLTGAGWGGCVVALCDSIDTSTKYIKELKDKYFSQLPPHIIESHQHNNFNDVVFATLPGNGAEIYYLT